MVWNRLWRPSAWILLAASSLALAAPRASAQESWDAVFLAGNKIGYIHTFVERVNEKGRPLNRVRVDTVLSFRRGDDQVVQKMMYGTIETPEGEVLRLDTRTLTSGSEIRVHGDAISGSMNLIMEGTQQRQEKLIPWGDDVRGPYAAEQSMAKQPMTEGESRKLKMYIPDLNRVVDIELKAGPISEIPLGDASTPLRKIEQIATLDGQHRPELSSTLWVDNGGQVLKQEIDLLGGMTTYRTTEAGAKAPGGRIKYDQIRGTIIKVARPITNPYQTRYIKYKITHQSEDPAKIIPNDRRQTVEPSGDDRSITLTIQTMGPNDGEAGPPTADSEYLRPNGLITSGDDRVKELAAKAVGDAVDPWDRAVRINEWVFKNMKSNFETTFAPANEAARSLSGDCTEHSVLAAAMSRALGIPSRVAVGLIYVDDKSFTDKGFGFHMWHEVYINGRWVALDSSFEQSNVDATHIKLSESSLEGVSPFESFLPILRVQGKITIEPIELR